MYIIITRFWNGKECECCKQEEFITKIFDERDDALYYLDEFPLQAPDGGEHIVALYSASLIIPSSMKKYEDRM